MTVLPTLDELTYHWIPPRIPLDHVRSLGRERGIEQATCPHLRQYLGPAASLVQPRWVHNDVS